MCEGSVHNRCRSANRSGAGCWGEAPAHGPRPSAPGPVITTHSTQWAGEFPSAGLWPVYPPSLPAGPTGTVWPRPHGRHSRHTQHGLGGGSQAPGWTNQSASQAGPPAGQLLLGFLRPRGVSTSFLLPPPLLSPLTCAGTEVCIPSSRTPLPLHLSQTVLYN